MARFTTNKLRKRRVLLQKQRINGAAVCSSDIVIGAKNDAFQPKIRRGFTKNNEIENVP